MSCGKPCYNCKEYSFRELDDISYSLNEQIAIVSDNFILEKKYGYNRDKAFKALVAIKNAIDRIAKRSYYNVEQCVCPADIQTLVEKAKKNIAHVCGQDCREDMGITANKDWALDANNCVSFEEWEKFLYKTCDIKFSETFKETCKFSFKIVSKVTDCKAIELVEELKRLCNLEIKETLDEYKCLYEYNEVFDNRCDMSFKEYYRLRCQGLTCEMVQAAADLGLYVDGNYNLICDGDIVEIASVDTTTLKRLFKI